MGGRAAAEGSKRSGQPWPKAERVAQIAKNPRRRPQRRACASVVVQVLGAKPSAKPPLNRVVHAPSDPALTPAAPQLKSHHRHASARSAGPSSSSTPTTRLDACAAALPARLPPSSHSPKPTFLRHRYVASPYGIRSYVGSVGTSTDPLMPLLAGGSAAHTLGSAVGGAAPSCFVPVARA